MKAQKGNKYSMKLPLPSLSYIYPSFSYKREDRQNDIYLNLRWNCSSIESKRFVDGVVSYISLREGWRYKPGLSMRKAAEAYVFGILSLPSLEEGIWIQRPFGMASFTGHYVGFKPFIKLHKGLVNAGFVEVRPGLHPRGSHGGQGIVTRLRPTPAFLSFAAERGLTPLNARKHFKPVDGPIAVREPVRVRAATKGDWWSAEKGKLLPVDPSNPKAAASIARVQRLNKWFAGVDIEGCTFEGFYRLFNQGDLTGFDFDKGGRLYAYGDYQRIEKEARRHIRINGEPVVEVDVSGSHTFLYHAMMDVPLLPGVDPYMNCGIDRRSVAKQFVNMTLGNGGPLRKWPDGAKASYLRDELGIELDDGEEYTKEQLSWLQRDYPIDNVKKAVLAAMPLLNRLKECGITWADLQYRESLGLLATVERLAFEYDVPALPLHDSVIVPLRYAALADRIMKECFWKEAGVRIGVKVKR